MFWLLLILSYLLGSVSFAILLSKLTGKSDPRLLGSGNPGATNMVRIAGYRLAGLTLLGDLLKGILPVFIAKWLDFTPTQQAWIGMAAVMGHIYPIYFRFKGGKGVATTIGMLLAVAPIIALLSIVIWAVCFFMTRISSLSSLIALLAATLLTTLLKIEIIYPMLLLCLLIIWRHHRNLYNLIIGHEQHF